MCVRREHTSLVFVCNSPESFLFYFLSIRSGQRQWSVAWAWHIMIRATLAVGTRQMDVSESAAAVAAAATGEVKCGGLVGLEYGDV